MTEQDIAKIVYDNSPMEMDESLDIAKALHQKFDQTMKNCQEDWKEEYRGLEQAHKLALSDARIEELELSLKAHERYSGTVGVNRIINERISQLKKARG